MYRHYIPISFLLGGLSLAASIVVLMIILESPNYITSEELFAIVYAIALTIVGIGLFTRKEVFRLLFILMMLVLMLAFTWFLYTEYSRGAGPPRIIPKIFFAVLMLTPPLFFLLVATHEKVKEEFTKTKYPPPLHE